MKKFFHFRLIIIFLVFLNCAGNAGAQGIYQLWGSTAYGGTDNHGVLFSSKYNATGFSVKKQFTVSKSGEPYRFNKPLVYNNKLYCILGGGGFADDGIIGEYDPASDIWVKRADLFTIGVRKSTAALILYNNKMYGVTSNGGINGEGAIFEFNPANYSLTKLYDFTEASGSYPRNSMVVYNNKFYGTTKEGGVNGDGGLYEFNPAGNVYINRVSFNSATSGRESNASLTVYAGALWGTTKFGALNNKGAIFSYDPDTDIFTKKKDLNNIGLAVHTGTLTLLNNKLYGGAVGGGLYNKGAIFQYDPVANILTKEYDFSATNADGSVEFSVYNAKLYACSGYGGANHSGVIFSFDPVTNIYNEHLSLGGLTGAMGVGSMSFYNNKFYGFTSYGGNNNKGTLFHFNPNDESYVNMVHFGGKEMQTPSGPLMYFNNKIYGTAGAGGNTLEGGIFEYNPATVAFNIKHHATDLLGRPGSDQGGFTLYNNKFYGVTIAGGIYGYGTLYEFDPITNAYTKKYDFDFATGSHPRGNPVVYNGKLYGMCTDGGINSQGIIYEFDLATNIYAKKIDLSNATGYSPKGSLTLKDNKFYGLCYIGGVNGDGTLFEWDPATNIIAKRFDFNDINGTLPLGNLTVFSNKLFGLTYNGGSAGLGVIFEYDPLTFSFIKRTDLNNTTGGNPKGNFTLFNNKLYCITNDGGANGVGTLLEFDPATGLCVKRTDLSVPTGNNAYANELTAIPALTAPGSPNSCTNTQTININASNANQWIQYTDAEGRAVAEINANGNILGNTAVRVYVNSGNIRQNADGVFYLDRNITISPATQPVTPVSVRLYIRKSEFDALKATAASGINVPTDLKIYKNNDFCAATMSTATELTTVKSDWATDYVYSAEVSSFSSFYFAKPTGVLPIKLLAFSGNKEALVNRLRWKATCTNDVNFTIERSREGIHFSEIGLVQATQQDCNMPFSFDDKAPITGKGFYRLKITESAGPVTYSQIIILDRNAEDVADLRIFPNPVVGSVVTAQVNASVHGNALITVNDMSGRTVISHNVTVAKGINSIQLNTETLAAGVYALVYSDGRAKQTVRFIKR